MSKEKTSLGPCAICGREMIDGPSVNEHHLVPKTFKGKDTITIHVVCHTKIHSVFTERELLSQYNTAESIREHEEMRKFITWISKKPPEFRDRNRATREKRGKSRR